MPCFKFLIYAPLLVLYVLVLVINNFCQQPDEQSTTQKTGIDPFPHVFLTQCFLLTLWINDSAHFHFSSKTSKTRHVRKTLQVRAEKQSAVFPKTFITESPCVFSPPLSEPQTSIDILTTVVRNTKPPLSEMLVCQAFPVVAQCTLRTDDNTIMQVNPHFFFKHEE